MFLTAALPLAPACFFFLLMPLRFLPGHLRVPLGGAFAAKVGGLNVAGFAAVADPCVRSRAHHEVLNLPLMAVPADPLFRLRVPALVLIFLRRGPLEVPGVQLLRRI